MTPIARTASAADIEVFAKQQTDENIVDLALQVYARSCMYDTKYQHDDAAMIYRAEILRRLAVQTSALQRELAELKAKNAGLVEALKRICDKDHTYVDGYSREVTSADVLHARAALAASAGERKGDCDDLPRAKTKLPQFDEAKRVSDFHRKHGDPIGRPIYPGEKP